MWKTRAVAALVVALGALGTLDTLVLTPPAAAAADDVKSVVEDATLAMGAAGLHSIVYSGAAANGNFGQSRTISFGLASTIRNYTRAIDFAQPASSPTGDTLPPAVRGGPPPQPGTYDQIITPANTAWAQQLQIWVTPWGFLKGAAAHAATLRSQKIGDITYKVVTWSPEQKAPSGQPYRVVGYINRENLIDRVETWVEHPVLGDLHIEMLYGNYQDFGGLKAPTKISMKQVGMETFVVAISGVRANPADLAQFMTAPPAPGRGGPPAAAAGAPAALPPVASEKLADGVYRITGGYVAMAVEFRDYVVVLEGGQSEARGLAIIAETKRLIPNKRIKYVVNTHPHFDHAGGLAPFAAEGITILTDDNNKYFVDAALSTPRTLVGDALAKSRKKPKVEGVIEQMELKDDTRTLQLLSRREARAQRRDAHRVSAEREDPVHRRLQRPGVWTTRQPVDCDAGREHRTAASWISTGT